MTEAMPFLQKTILLSYDPRSLRRGGILYLNSDEFLMALPKLSGPFFVLSVTIRFHFPRSAVVPHQDPLKVIIRCIWL